MHKDYAIHQATFNHFLSFMWEIKELTYDSIPVYRMASTFQNITNC